MSAMATTMPPPLQGTRVLVLGLGASGLAMAQWCARGGAAVTAWDSRLDGADRPPQADALAASVPQAALVGGALGTIAVITRQEIVLAIMGGIFVVEALSVMLQASWFKFTKKRFGKGRRILKMAPLHHHFEKSGWTETQVVVRFWIITMLLCLIGLASLKLR